MTQFQHLDKRLRESRCTNAAAEFGHSSYDATNVGSQFIRIQYSTAFPCPRFRFYPYLCLSTTLPALYTLILHSLVSILSVASTSFLSKILIVLPILVDRAIGHLDQS